jgi:hypothetical protein
MRDALSNVLFEDASAEEPVTRILAAAFFRKRPLQAGSVAHVVPLVDRKSVRGGGDETSFLQGGQRR